MDEFFEYKKKPFGPKRQPGLLTRGDRDYFRGASRRSGFRGAVDREERRQRGELFSRSHSEMPLPRISQALALAFFLGAFVSLYLRAWTAAAIFGVLFVLALTGGLIYNDLVEGRVWDENPDLADAILDPPLGPERPPGLVEREERRRRAERFREQNAEAEQRRAVEREERRRRAERFREQNAEVQERRKG